MSNLKYSVLMTVYRKDNPDYFNLSLQSMINQTVLPDEIILVKDGPITDELQVVIDKIKLTSRCKIQDIQLEKNIGLGLALNEGIKYVNNELIARMDSDDYSLPDRCEKQLYEFEKDMDLDIVGCSVLEFEGDLDNITGKRSVPLTNEEIHKYCRRRDPFNHPSVMYKKSSLEKVGCYGDYRKNQDTDLWIKLLRNGCKGLNIDEPLLLFRFDEKTYKKRKNWLNTKLLIQIRYRAYKQGFGTLVDLLMVTISQLLIFIMPINLQRYIYKRFLRKKK